MGSTQATSVPLIEDCAGVVRSRAGSILVVPGIGYRLDARRRGSAANLTGLAAAGYPVWHYSYRISRQA